MRRAFTLLEIIVVMVLIGLSTALVISNLNLGKNASDAAAANLQTSFAAIESAFLNYNSDKMQYPNTTTNGLTDATFVPGYLFAPQVPAGFDETYGHKGYLLKGVTLAALNQNGYYICAKKPAGTATDPAMRALESLTKHLSSDKYFYNSACPATTNSAPGAGVMYATYWINRY